MSKVDLSKICCCAEKALDGESRKKTFFGWYVSDVWWKWRRKNQKVEHWGKQKIEPCFQSQFEIYKRNCDFFFQSEWHFLMFVQFRETSEESFRNLTKLFTYIRGKKSIFFLSENLIVFLFSKNVCKFYFQTRED
jgi:hypothetical protein